MKRIADAFYKSGLGLEFLETLINDNSLPLKLRRQIWTLTSTEFPNADQCLQDIADTFADCTDAASLIAVWSTVVGTYWPHFQPCSLKVEIDAL